MPLYGTELCEDTGGTHTHTEHILGAAHTAEL